ncbi:hypothetical protein NBRC10512_007037 [Rhodotorula toruloides]|uniref:RHTO0S16e02718g1_1 n=2 Tax=Rhodotorula toruloides TaxID=5286 RepID=A0A061BM85_RHOTO|nr:WD repeat domain 89 [Rhodotorula toruloides NP11]EMS20993.1 WD repeat domain 89 [Rhodotorula toruloides NP11]CDR48168.1 RHTO0S16e02718g1_1 [Rhodotorula toruloides]
MAHRIRLPPPLLYPSTTSTPLALVAQTPFKPDAGPNPPYVLQTVPFSQGYLFFGSDDTVRAFSPSLQPLAQLNTTQRGITSIVAGAKGSNAVFITAKDGSVSAWDTRDLSKEAFKLQGKTRAAYLCASQSSDHSALAVGTELHQYEAMIDIWDLRTMKLQHTYTEAHSDDITAVAFHPSPSLSHALLSASVDGLINTYDVRIADEDDAVQSTSQVGASLAHAGWMALAGQEASQDLKGVFGATTIETLQYWDIEQQEQLVDFGDVRDVALQPWRTDYMIGAHYNEALGGVCLLAGTIAGDVAVINARDKESWYLEQVLSGKTSRRNYGCKGHRDIVRAAHLDAATSTVVTGGEDGQICLWQV